MVTKRIDPSDFLSIVPPRIAEAESRMSLDRLRARFARHEGLPFADVLTAPRIRDALDEHGVRYRDRVFNPVTTTWGFLSQVLSDDAPTASSGSGGYLANLPLAFQLYQERGESVAEPFDA